MTTPTWNHDAVRQRLAGALGPQRWKDGDERCHCTHCEACGVMFRTVDIPAHRLECWAEHARADLVAAVAEIERLRQVASGVLEIHEHDRRPAPAVERLREVVASFGVSVPEDRELDDDDLARIARSWEFHRAHQPCGASKAPPGWWCTRVVDHDGPCAAVDGFPTGHPPEEVAGRTAADVEMYVEHIRALMQDGVNPTTARLAARAGATDDEAQAVLDTGCESGRIAAPPSDRPWVGYRFRSQGR